MIDKKTIEEMKKTLEKGVTTQVVPQLFPTPKKISEQIYSMLDIKRTERILEPQAGNGDLIRPLISSGHDSTKIVAVEINGPLCEHLRTSLPNIEVHHKDFLSVEPLELGLFDKVTMNPPFSKLQDIEHIQHAFKFLKAGGGTYLSSFRGAIFQGLQKIPKIQRVFRAVRCRSYKTR